MQATLVLLHIWIGDHKDRPHAVSPETARLLLVPENALLLLIRLADVVNCPPGIVG